ncbi:hypothetical protein ACFL2Q_05540 [Thermodesulfobacteriota bacterium]
MSAECLGDTEYTNLGNGWWFKYAATTDACTWSKGAGSDAAGRFRYAYLSGNWKHRSVPHGKYTWHFLNTATNTDIFIGDGTARTTADGLNYKYNDDLVTGQWLKGTDLRFQYAYGSGQWDQVRGTSYSTLGAAGLSAKLRCTTTLRNLDGTMQFKYSFAADCGKFFKGTIKRFEYNFTTGQWTQIGSYGSALLGPAGLAPYNMGFYQNPDTEHELELIAGTLSFFYDSSKDQGCFNTPNLIPTGESARRLKYSYGPGQWKHKGAFQSTYDLLGTTAMAPANVGTDTWAFAGTNWTYRFVPRTGLGLPEKGEFYRKGSQLFSYNYVEGTWYHHSSASLAELSSSGRTAKLPFGDGKFHEIRDGWYYAFVGQTTTGYFSTTPDPAFIRFSYSYLDPSAWLHYSLGQFGSLGPFTSGPTFMGDGEWHDVGSGWDYRYDYPSLEGGDAGYWRRHTDPTSTGQFVYRYLLEQWSHKGPYDASFRVLSGTGASPEAPINYPIDLKNGFFLVVTANSGEPVTAIWGTGPDAFGTRIFQYEYDTGIWKHTHFDKLDDSILNDKLGMDPDPMGSEFIGNGEWHDLGIGWYYRYKMIGGDTVGQWRRKADPPDTDDITPLFQYSYGAGTWWHAFANSSNRTQLSNPVAGGYFIGQGNSDASVYYKVQVGPSYDYTYWDNGWATWYTHGTDDEQYEYDYNTGTLWGWSYGFWVTLNGPGADAPGNLR